MSLPHREEHAPVPQASHQASPGASSEACGPDSRGRLTLEQEDAYSSPWSVRARLKMALWNVVWLVLFRPTPKPLSPWRVFLLRLFGCRASGRPFVAASAIIKMPWNLVLHDRACLGDRVEVYNLGPVTLGARCTIAQHTYLCTGTHDLSLPSLPLVVGRIAIGPDVFVGARALILAGVTVGEGAVVGAGACVFKDVEPWTVVGGNPARFIKTRAMQAQPDSPR